MKALIRNEGETITEDMEIPCIDWNTGYPLTSAAWFGGPYTLVENYVELSDGAIYDVAVYPEPEEEPIPTPAAEEPEVEVVPNSNVVIIDGKEYTKEELRALLGE